MISAHWQGLPHGNREPLMALTPALLNFLTEDSFSQSSREVNKLINFNALVMLIGVNPVHNS